MCRGFRNLSHVPLTIQVLTESFLSFGFMKVVDGLEGREVQLINRKSLRLLTSQLLALLMSQDNEQVVEGMKVEELSQLYQSLHGTQLNPCEYGFLSLSEMLKSLPYLVEVRNGFLFKET